MILPYAILIATLLLGYAILNFDRFFIADDSARDIIASLSTQNHLRNDSYPVDFTPQNYADFLEVQRIRHRGAVGLWVSDASQKKIDAVAARFDNFANSYVNTLWLLQRAGDIAKSAGNSESRINEAIGNFVSGDDRELDLILSEIGDKNANILYTRAELKEETGDWEKAFQLYATASEREPSNYRYLNKAGVMAMHLGQTENAERYIGRELDIHLSSVGASHPWSLMSRLNLALILSRGDDRVEEAHKHYLETLEATRGLSERSKSYVPFLAPGITHLAKRFGVPEELRDAYADLTARP